MEKKEIEKKNKIAMGCDYCSFYMYDEDDESYFCDKDLDEDEMYRFLTGQSMECPYFQYGDEYRVVRHQM